MSEKTTPDPNTLEALLASMTPEIHQALKTAVELGHWENGEKLSARQKEDCLQAIIAYDKVFVSPEQRVGYINREGSTCSTNDVQRKTGLTTANSGNSNNTH